MSDKPSDKPSTQPQPPTTRPLVSSPVFTHDWARLLGEPVGSHRGEENKEREEPASAAEEVKEDE